MNHTNERISIYPRIPQDEATQEVRKSLARNDGESEGHLEAFLTVADSIMHNMRAFTREDFITRARPFDIPLPNLFVLFDRWATAMEQMGKLSLIEGAYEEPSYIVQ